MVKIPVGINSHVMMRRILLMPVINSESVSSNLFAAAVNFPAYESAPTFVAW